MLLATWNVNSIRMRADAVCAWLEANQPHVLALQELKGEDSTFPAEAFRALGYDAVVVGQKAYNGVALLSRLPMTVTARALPGDATDAEARYVEADIAGLRVGGLYLPNGNPTDGTKYPYKLHWMARLRQHAQTLLAAEIPFVLMGDYNVIPAPEDCYAPEAWEGDALYRPETRAAWRALIHLGLTDALRTCHPGRPKLYSFWDYQAGRWPRDEGLRIDHVLLSPQAADTLQSAHVDPGPRGWDKPSDHTPVVVALGWKGPC